MTNRQKAFIEEYAKSGNATDAYKKVYNEDHRGAANSACRLMRTPKFREQLEKYLEEMENKSIPAARVYLKLLDA